MHSATDLSQRPGPPEPPPAMRAIEQDPTRLEEPAAAGAERRTHERHALHVDVAIGGEHAFYTGFAQNISRGGLFVATRDLKPIGHRMPITFTIPGYDRTIDVTCEVRWQRLEQLDSVECVPGMGLTFLNLRPEDQDAVNAFIDGRETLFFDDE